jgi:hypothetical protein
MVLWVSDVGGRWGAGTPRRSFFIRVSGSGVARPQAPGTRGLGLGRGGKIPSFTVAFCTVQHYLVL